MTADKWVIDKLIIWNTIISSFAGIVVYLNDLNQVDKTLEETNEIILMFVNWLYNDKI